MAEKTETNPNGAGRPESDEEMFFRKLQPHLQSGKSLRRACLLAEIPYSTVWQHYDKKGEFADKIDAASAFAANLVSNLFFGRVVDIANKKSGLEQLQKDLKDGKINKEDLPTLQAQYEITDKDWEFIRWYATNSKATRDDYGNRLELTGKDGEALVPSATTEDIARMLQDMFDKKDGIQTKSQREGDSKSTGK